MVFRKKSFPNKMLANLVEQFNVNREIMPFKHVVPEMFVYQEVYINN